MPFPPASDKTVISPTIQNTASPVQSVTPSFNVGSPGGQAYSGGTTQIAPGGQTAQGGGLREFKKEDPFNPLVPPLTPSPTDLMATIPQLPAPAYAPQDFFNKNGNITDKLIPILIVAGAALVGFTVYKKVK